ncbi:hypothetical protein [Faecalibaculum rodentium]|uniref:hypothetical protein n=1 Tax=Faecalibaculum rodentium TaxID=1702221 RepID=UPI0023F0CF31|nr:hypothetical protein [Faecalibaculum rodentium]
MKQSNIIQITVPLLLALFLLPLAGLAGCSGEVALRKHTFTIELGQDVYANPALYAESGQQGLEHMTVSPISTGIARKDNRFISRGYDYLLVGEYDFVIENGGTSTPFRIKIKDTRPPTVISEVTEMDATVGERIDWVSVFPATDISGVSYEAPFDTTATPGDHDVTVKISDRFGNAVEKPVRVKVSE